MESDGIQWKWSESGSLPEQFLLEYGWNAHIPTDSNRFLWVAMFVVIIIVM